MARLNISVRAAVSELSDKNSYLEIYNEEIRDLLHKHNRHKLVVKEHPEKGKL